MKIFLHIGMPKTGSTTIQRTLMLGQDRLARAGIYYPYRTDFLYGLVTGTDRGAPLDLPKNCRTLIISDERLFNRVRSPADAQLIADALREISPDINLLCYVRREDEVFVSAYFTRLLMGGAERFQELPLSPVQTYKRLQSWKSAFGRNGIMLRRFGRSYLPAGLVADFAEAVGIADVELPEAPRANSSPRCDVLELIRLLNATRGKRELNRYPLKALARVVGFGDRIGLSAEKRTILIEKAKEQDSRLSRHFFGGEPVFTHPIEDDEPHWPEIGVGDIVRIGETMGQISDLAVGKHPANVPDGLEWIRELAERSSRGAKSGPPRPKHKKKTFEKKKEKRKKAAKPV